MTPLIAMPGLRLPETDAATGTMLPGLPALSALLRSAKSLPSAIDWRNGVLQTLLGDVSAHAPAVIAAQALSGVRPGLGVCLVTPVHAVAGMSRVHLPPGGLLNLSRDEGESLRAAFNREFGAPDVVLHAVGSGWLLQAPCANAADDADPEVLLGEPLSRQPAGTAAGRQLRRLGAEVEMWLAALPLNRERARRNLPAVNAFWFWSGAETVALCAAPAAPARIVSPVAPDAWLTGLASHLSATVQAGVRRWSDIGDAGSTVVVLQPPDRNDLLGHWPRWESEWLAPAYQAVNAGTVRALRLQIGRTAWQLPATPFTRWFRAARPWWQVVGA